MDKSGKKMRYSDAEMATLKANFAENEPLLKAIRKVFLQIPISTDEVKILSNAFSKPEVCAVINKTFLPQIDGDAPMYQVIDLWMTVDLKDKGLTDAGIILNARKFVIEYLGQQLHKLALFGKDAISEEILKFSDLSVPQSDIVDWIKNINARNTIVSHVEQQLHQINVLAGLTKETVEETQARLAKDSLK